MSMARAKENLERLHADNEIRDMALPDKWGTGKSHMWKCLRDASKDSAVEASLYVSLFGETSIAELKLKRRGEQCMGRIRRTKSSII